MISFPICKRLQIVNYGLFPGLDNSHDLDIEFGPGLTLILGANGLGKTTLITMLFRLMSGPSDLRLSSGKLLGTVSLNAIDLGPVKRREFAQRVRDGAESASATLTFALGGKQIAISRSLRNLQMISLKIDGSEIASADEQAYIDVVCKNADVYAFGDFLLLLRQLVFYFEDRRALVWDNTAQRQIFRALFLNSEDAKQWSQLERTALKLDSELRNTQAIMTRQERSTKKTESKQATVSEVRTQIETLEKIQVVDTNRQDLLGSRAAELNALLARFRLNMLRAEQTAESAKRNVEHAQLSVIERAFPSVDESMRYVFAQLVSDGVCRACGQLSPAAVERMQHNLTLNLCALCDTPLPVGEIVSVGELTTKRIDKTRDDAAKAKQHLSAAQKSYREVRYEYAQVQNELAELSNAIEGRFQQLHTLMDLLPPEESAQRDALKALDALQTRVESLRAQLAEAQENFSEFVKVRTRHISSISEQLKMAFNEYAQGFLLERVILSWAPVQQRLGQYRENPIIEFPAFSLDVTGSDFSEPMRREGPDQVSESQREFIDLAFRMALIKIASSDQTGTLVIDAPESSLDAVFVKRASSVLGRYALATRDNRLIITSNLLTGDLLPELISASSDSTRTPKIIDLFELGVPTAALLELGDEYAYYRKQLKDQIEVRKEEKAESS